jgi:folate-binding protein YgfZ
VIELRGNDRTQFLHSFCTNDVRKLAAGTGCEAFVTNHHGKTVGHGFIFCEPERLVIGTVAGQAKTLVSHFERFVISEDVQFRDLSDEVQIFVIAGRSSATILRELTAMELPGQQLDFIHPQIARSVCTLFRVPYGGDASYFLRAAAAEAPAVRECLQAAGMQLCGAEAVEALRLAAGFPYYGLDISEDNLPQEVGRDTQAISFTKGCYLGQETVARIDALGHVNRLLVRILFQCDRVPGVGTMLSAGGKAVGQTCSGAWFPPLARPLAMAYVRRAQSAAGTVLECDSGPGEVVSQLQIRPLPENSA